VHSENAEAAANGCCVLYNANENVKSLKLLH